MALERLKETERAKQIGDVYDEAIKEAQKEGNENLENAIRFELEQRLRSLPDAVRRSSAASALGERFGIDLSREAGEDFTRTALQLTEGLEEEE